MKPAHVWVVTVEGNTDYFSDVLGVYRTKVGATEARDADAEEQAGLYGHVIEHLDEDNAHWTRSYTITKMDVQ